MNERIQELLNKAAESTAAYPSGQNNSWETQVNFMEKFAELIVRDCAEKFAAEPDRPFYGRHVSYHIKKHFGVEE